MYSPKFKVGQRFREHGSTYHIRGIGLSEEGRHVEPEAGGLTVVYITSRSDGKTCTNVAIIADKHGVLLE